MSGTELGLGSRRNVLDKLYLQLFHESSLTQNIRAIKRGDTIQIIMEIPLSSSCITNDEIVALKKKIRTEYELGDITYIKGKKHEKYIIAVGWTNKPPEGAILTLSVQHNPLLPR